MKVNNKVLDLNYLALEVLKQCPEAKSYSFVRGFTRYVEELFGTIEDCSLVFADFEGNYEIDLGLIDEVCSVPLEVRISKLALSERTDFKKGIAKAKASSSEALILAFQNNAINSEAA